MLAIKFAEFGSTGIVEMSWFQGLFAGKRRLPCRLAPGPRSGTAVGVGEGVGSSGGPPPTCPMPILTRLLVRPWYVSPTRTSPTSPRLSFSLMTTDVIDLNPGTPPTYSTVNG